MKILGICESHTATAALIIDGRLVACASEERFSRVKAHTGFPKMAVKFVLNCAGVHSSELDQVVFPFQSSEIVSYYDQSTPSPVNENLTGMPKLISSFAEIWDTVAYKIRFFNKSNRCLSRLRTLLFQNRFTKRRLQYVQENLGISQDRISFVDHHTAHAYAAYCSLETVPNKDCLVITLDGKGDDICAMVSKFCNGIFTTICNTPNYNSLGMLYSSVTKALGMTPNEHEYKVMGLAPYSDREKAKQYLPIFHRLMKINDDLSFESLIDDRLFFLYMKEHAQKIRFDYLAGAVQLFTEEILCEWISRLIKKTKIHDIVLGGGVFMNVKANKRILELPEVESLHICPSGGDESTAFGAAFAFHVKQEKQFTQVKELYLGPEFSTKQIRDFLLENKAFEKYEVIEPHNIEKLLAELLAKNAIVARFDGRMEYGARALGNRSILANPSELSIIKILNKSIKNRDFWMPFAGTVLAERADDYLVNPKEIKAPYMTIAFDTTPLGQKHLKAAIHPYDQTIRVQILEREWNCKFYDIIKAFEEHTGIGGVLNTSFNLHGEPMVCNLEDALKTFKFSALKYLVIGKFLLKKKEID